MFIFSDVCVATRGRSRHEITELSLPDKLCTSEDLVCTLYLKRIVQNVNILKLL